MPTTPSLRSLLLAAAATTVPWSALAADVRVIEPPSYSFAAAATNPSADPAPAKPVVATPRATAQTETVAILAADGSVQVQCRGGGLRDFRHGPVTEQER